MIDEAWASKIAAPVNHPLVNTFFVNDLPAVHPSIDLIIRNPGAYIMPLWHPPIDPYIKLNVTKPMGEVGIPISFTHPDINLSLINGSTVFNHPIVNNYWLGYLPSNHSNIDEILANPSAHPYPMYFHNIKC
jgi:hypothetical protein